jgi:uncharacterized protein YecT (DUF1311 family)
MVSNVEKNVSGSRTAQWARIGIAVSVFIALHTITLSPVKAQDRKPDCPDAKTTLDAINCYEKLADETDDRVKELVQKILNLKPDEKLRAGFQQAQESWEKYREQSCTQIWNFWNPGTIKNPESVRCRVILNRQRIKFLQDMYEVPLHH